VGVFVGSILGMLVMALAIIGRADEAEASHHRAERAAGSHAQSGERVRPVVGDRPV
jgi:hypothetical protein